MTQDHSLLTDKKEDLDSLAVNFGQRLAEARKKGKKSVGDIAQSLFITSAVVARIESGQWDEAGPDVYVRGYVLGYGRLVDIDPGDALQFFRQREMARVARNSREAQSRQRRPGIMHYQRLAAYAVASLLIGPAIIFWVAQGFRSGEPLVANQQLDQEQLGATVLGADWELNSAEALPVNKQPVMASMAALPEPLVQPGSQQTMSAPAEQAVEPLQADSSSGLLELTFSEDVWLDVSDARGTRMGYGLMPANSERSFSTDLGLKVRLGNARAVLARVDGQDFDLSPYIRQDVANFVLPEADEHAGADLDESRPPVD